MPLLVPHEDPVIAELERELSKLMPLQDRKTWLVRHETTRGKDTDMVWEQWVAWLIRNPGFGLQSAVYETAKLDDRCAPAVQKMLDASDAFELAADLRVLLGERYTKIFVDIFLDLVNEAQRIGYEVARSPYDPGAALKEALWGVAFAAAAVAFRDRHHHVVAVVASAARAVSLRRGFVVDQRERAWAAAAAAKLTDLILGEERP